MCYAHVIFGGDYIKQIQTKYIIKNIFRSDNRLEEFTENHLLLLITLQEYTTYRNKIYINFSLIFEKLNITHYQLKKELYQCIIDLHDLGLINIININNLGNITQNTNIIIDKIDYENNYTLLVAEEIDKILYNNLDIRTRRTMLYIYTVICSWIGINGKDYCFPKIEDFKKDIKTTSNKRIINAIQYLKRLDLIDYTNAGVVKGGKYIYQSNNIYVLTITEDYKLVLQRAIEESKFYYEVNVF